MTAQILPVTSSASGKDNAYTLRCLAIGRSMAYPSCIARLGALDAEGVRTPADWSECAAARGVNRCQAANMRQEELLKGCSIYFQPRAVMGAALPPARSWGVKAPAPAPKPAPDRAGSVFDGIAEAGSASYSDAISAPLARLAAPAPAPRPAISMQANESPLQAARRIAAERQAAAQPK